MKVKKFTLHDHGQKEIRKGHKPRIYISHSGESVIENLINRHSRPKDLYRECLDEVLVQIGWVGYPVHWSQKAGCNCGCSPGFIVKNSNFHQDLWIEVEA